jgi:SAM-dependent methyltransferase
MSTKAIQGKLWSVAPQYWSQHFEPCFIPMYKNVLRRLKLTEQTLLLDAGCGAGLFSSMAIQLGAQVIGVDAAPGLLKEAKRRNPANNFLEEDLEALPFVSDSFDIVAGFNSFQYAGNFENALKEAKRVLTKNGQLVIGIWDRPELSEATNILKAISNLLPPPPPCTPGPFALSEDGAIETILNNIGMNTVYKSSVGCPLFYSNLSDAVKSFMGTGPAAAACNYADELTVRDVIAEAFQPFRVTEDFYHLQNQFLVFIAEK